MKVFRILALAIMLCLASTVAIAGWFSSSDKPLTPEAINNDRGVQKAIDDLIYSKYSALGQKINDGEIQKGSAEAKVAVAKIFVEAFEQEGYSLDETLNYCFSQRNQGFWVNYSRFYGDSLNFFLFGMDEAAFKELMYKNEIITEKTLKSFQAYQAWSK